VAKGRKDSEQSKQTNKNEERKNGMEMKKEWGAN